MSSVATAPTATAAQTSAAGSRMLGYYLGGGGVKVDCLFDTSNFLTKDVGGQYTLPDGSAAAPALSFGVDLDTGIYRITGNALGIAAGGAERLRVTSTVVEVSVSFSAQSSANKRIRVVDAVHGTLTNLSTAITFSRGSDTGELAAIFGANNGGLALAAREGLTFCAGGGSLYGATVEIIKVTGTDMRPATDNLYDLGTASLRFDDVYATTGTIQTSDAREKTWRGAPSFAELAAARRIAAELGFYQWNDAIAEKGEDGARYHFGVRAQAVWAIMADEGLIDPIVEGEPPTSSYAFLCYDEWPEVEAVAEERDEEGNITVAAVEAREAGNRFGIRPDQLTLFLIAAQEARLAALEAA